MTVIHYMCIVFCFILFCSYFDSYSLMHVSDAYVICLIIEYVCMYVCMHVNEAEQINCIVSS